MDSSSDNLNWALHMGLVIGAPIGLINGSFFAFGTTTSSVHSTWPKFIGWVGGIPFSLVTGAMIAPHLVPSFHEKIGAFYCAGYGWFSLWALISMFGHEDSSLARLIGKAFDRLKKSKGLPKAGKSPLRLKKNALKGKVGDQ